MNEPEAVEYEEVAVESPSQAVRRKRSRRRVPTRQVRRRMRMAYFSLAALWGFLAGSGAVIIGLSATGRPVPLGRPAVLTIAAAAVLAVLGAFVVAAGYRAASQRYR